MYAMDRLISLVLRIGQLIFSTVVAGITGAWLHKNRHSPAWSHKRFIYTEVVAGLGMLFSLLFLLPFIHNIMHYPMDFVLFALFMVAFGLLASFIGPLHCGSVFNWHGITGKSQCNRMKADIAFCFLASMFFLGSMLLGIWVVHRRKDAAIPAERRRRFGRRNQVV